MKLVDPTRSQDDRAAMKLAHGGWLDEVELGIDDEDPDNPDYLLRLVGVDEEELGEW